MSAVAAPFHLIRAGVIAGATVALAAGAHVLAGGILPAPLIMAALTALTVLSSVIATRFRLGMAAMATLLVLSQLLLHQGFDALSASTAAAVSDPALHHVGLRAAMQMSGAMQMPAAVHSGSAPATLMLLAHLAATVATAVVLAKGEDALWALAGWLRPLVQLPAVVRPSGIAHPVSAGPAPVRRLPWRNLRLNSLRGPPAAPAVATF